MCGLVGVACLVLDVYKVLALLDGINVSDDFRNITKQKKKAGNGTPSGCLSRFLSALLTTSRRTEESDTQVSVHPSDVECRIMSDLVAWVPHAWHVTLYPSAAAPTTPAMLRGRRKVDLFERVRWAPEAQIEECQMHVRYESGPTRQHAAVGDGKREQEAITVRAVLGGPFQLGLTSGSG